MIGKFLTNNAHGSGFYEIEVRCLIESKMLKLLFLFQNFLSNLSKCSLMLLIMNVRLRVVETFVEY